MSLRPLRFQFEIRYTNILNFNSVAREAISPFIKLASNIVIVNQGQLEEQIKLDFDSNWSLDVRWDRVIAISESDINVFQEETSSLNILFSILEQLSLAKSFGTIKDYLLFATFVKIVDQPIETITESFRTKFLKDNVFDIFKSDDYRITFEKTNDDKVTTVSIGTFSEKDLILKNIYTYIHQSPDSTDVGYIMDIKFYEKISKANYNLFKGLVRQANKSSEILNKI